MIVSSASHLRCCILATENAVAARIEGGSAEVNALGYSLDVPRVGTTQMPRVSAWRLRHLLCSEGVEWERDTRRRKSPYPRF